MHVTIIHFARETKIVLKGENSEMLQMLQGKAELLGLATHLVEDAGRTQVSKITNIT